MAQAYPAVSKLMALESFLRLLLAASHKASKCPKDRPKQLSHKPVNKSRCQNNDSQ